MMDFFHSNRNNLCYYFVIPYEKQSQGFFLLILTLPKLKMYRVYFLDYYVIFLFFTEELI